MTDLDRYKAKLNRLLKHKAEEPNNTYHDWDAEIQRCKNNIADEVMDEKTGWIPVAEGLPKEDMYCWVTVAYPGAVRCVHNGYYQLDTGFSWSNVVAWVTKDALKPYLN